MKTYFFIRKMKTYFQRKKTTETIFYLSSLTWLFSLYVTPVITPKNNKRDEIDIVDIDDLGSAKFQSEHWIYQYTII